MAKVSKIKATPKSEPVVEETKVEITEDTKEIVKDFTSAFGRAPKVSLEAIQEMIEGEEAERTMEEWRLAIKGLEDNVDGDKKKTPHVVNPNAAAIAGKLAASTDFVETVLNIVQVKEDSKRLPAQAALYMSKLLTKEDRAAMPIPGSKKSDLPAGSNALYDIGKVGEPSFYQDLWASFPFAAQTIKDIESCKGADGKIKGPKAKADHKMYTARKNNAVGAVKAGVNILNRMDEIHERVDIKLRCGFRLDPESEGKKIDRTTSPIWVAAENDSHSVQFYSIGTFLGVKLDVVAKQDTPAKQLAAFDVERKPRTKKGESNEPVSIGTANQVIDAFYELANTIEDKTVMSTVEKEMNGAGSDDLLLNMHAVRAWLDRRLERPALKTRLQALLEAQDSDVTEKKDAA